MEILGYFLIHLSYPQEKTMNNQQYIKSIIKISEVIILIIGAIPTLCLGIYCISNEVYSFGIPILFFGLLCIYILLDYDILYVSRNEILIKSIRGNIKKKIPLNTSNYYTEIEKENATTGAAHRKWKELTLIGNNFSYCISSSTYTNYPKLKKGLIKGLKRNKALEKEWERKNSLK